MAGCSYIASNCSKGKTKRQSVGWIVTVFLGFVRSRNRCLCGRLPLASAQHTFASLILGGADSVSRRVVLSKKRLVRHPPKSGSDLSLFLQNKDAEFQSFCKLWDMIFPEPKSIGMGRGIALRKNSPPRAPFKGQINLEIA